MRKIIVSTAAEAKEAERQLAVIRKLKDAFGTEGWANAIRNIYIAELKNSQKAKTLQP